MATTGSGQPVPYQREMEEAFAENFDNVRAYPGRAGEMRMLDAVAATRGTFIAFRDTHPSRETVAHELVHVVQQRLHGIVSPLSLGQICNPEEPAEREATRLAFRVAEGKKVAIKQSINGRIARQVAVPMIGDIEEKSESQASEIPPEIMAAIETTMERSDDEAHESSLRRLGQLAIRLLGPEGVITLARQAGVRGAERRQHEVESRSGRTIHRQAAEAAAATAGTMWWLTLVDGPLPIGDIVYGALILGAAIAASRALRNCRCSIRYAPPDIMAQCPERVYGKGLTMHDCQNVAKFTAPQQCRRYYGHCGWMP